MISTTFSRVAILLFLGSSVIAAPVNNLEARADCADGNDAPCICGNAIGLREKSLSCGTQSFKFTDPASPTDGTVSLVSGNSGSLQCGDVILLRKNLYAYSIVELQFVADEVAKVPGICTHFAANPAAFAPVFNTLNTGANLVFVESTVNNAKGIVFGGKNFVDTTQKAANGVISYLGLLASNPASKPSSHVATTIDAAMTTAMNAVNAPGFQAGFQGRWNSAVSSAITKARGQVSKLDPAPAPGDPFIDQTASTIAKCTTRRRLWGSFHDFVVRAVTGKPAATPASCPLPAKKPVSLVGGLTETQT
ncbi:hypothetical protein C8F01DRAFT_972690 [Mycena amicta]|nr:hypothetical protein C8F01DRAFT_972690 [Mycena amicta]